MEDILFWSPWHSHRFWDGIHSAAASSLMVMAHRAGCGHYAHGCVAPDASGLFHGRSGRLCLCGKEGYATPCSKVECALGDGAPSHLACCFTSVFDANLNLIG
jgi:hypothetical protein